MAIIPRYFSTSAAGLADGTSWANRAELLPSGNWSTIITGADYSADSLIAFIGPGTYATPGLTTASFSVAAPTPTTIGRLALKGCDADGTQLTDNAEWNCCQGPLDITNYPLFNFSAVFNIGLAIDLSHLNLVRNSGTTSIITSGSGIIDRCRLEQAVSGTGVSILASFTGEVLNSEVVLSGNSWSQVWNTPPVCQNVRFKGNPNASSGSRNGLAVNTGAIFLFPQNICVLDFPGNGLFNSNTASTTSGLRLIGVTINNCGVGANVTGQVSGTGYLQLLNCMITNCAVGASFVNTNRYLANKARLRNTTNFASSSVFDITLLDAPGSDSDEYVDAANGDFRIKHGSDYWGKAIGAGDEPITSGGGVYNPFQQQRIR